MYASTPALLSLILLFPSIALAFFESFDDNAWGKRWKHSSHPKYTGRFITSQRDNMNSMELRMPERSKHYGITMLLPGEPLDPASEQGLIVQFETTTTDRRAPVECGGRYLKLVTAQEGFRAEDLMDQTPFSIMFGPDQCGPTGKVHLILRHRSPLPGASDKGIEKHWTPSPALASPDNLPHVYTLILNSTSNMVKILVDGEVKTVGNLLNHLKPPINPPKEIPDPSHVKPEGWVDQERIPDPEAKQPEDWDSRKEIPDDTAVKPEGWLEDEPMLIPKNDAVRPADWHYPGGRDWQPPKTPNPKCAAIGCGPWRRPMKPNLDYKGEWQAPLVDNPEYKGPWVQKMIPNPDYYYDLNPLSNIGLIGAVAFEIWTVDEGYQFDNLYIGHDEREAERLRSEVWRPKFEATKKAIKQEERGRENKRLKDEMDLARAKKRNSQGDGQARGLPAWMLKAYDSGALGPRVTLWTRPLADAIRRTPAAAYMLFIIPVGMALFFAILSIKVPDHVTRLAELEIEDDDEDNGGGGGQKESGTEGGRSRTGAPSKAEDAISAQDGRVSRGEGQGQGGEDSEGAAAGKKPTIKKRIPRA